MSATIEYWDYPANHGKEWTTDDHMRLVRLYAQTSPQLTWFTIAAKMKRTIPACEIRMRMLWVAFSLSNDKSLHDALLGTPKVKHNKTTVKNSHKVKS